MLCFMKRGSPFTTMLLYLKTGYLDILETSVAGHSAKEYYSARATQKKPYPSNGWMDYGLGGASSKVFPQLKLPNLLEDFYYAADHLTIKTFSKALVLSFYTFSEFTLLLTPNV